MKSDSRHATFLMDLRGSRLVVMSETGQGRSMDAATAKKLTGGDRIRANRMRRDPIEFVPSHQIVMVTNFKPKVSGDDPALWRRLRVVPFDWVAETPDPKLPEELEMELPAVLAWVIQGYISYVAMGLAAPEAVTARTDAYQADSDALARFLTDKVQINPNSAVPARELFAAWAAWCRETGEEYGTEPTFAEGMKRRGHESVRKTAGKVYPGLFMFSQPA
jgi:putative DNA primase/helicase